jgi:phosphatidate cytidylyltransferase
MIFTELQKRVTSAVILLPVVIFTIIFSQHFFNLLLLLALFFSFIEWFKLNKKNFNFISISGFVIILLSIFFAYYLRGNDIKSKTIFLWIVFVCFFSDTGGYFVGKFFGGKKISKISPKKTYAGMYGSFIFSIFPILIVNFFESNILILSTKSIILSLLFSLLCQLGDMTVSYFKRKNKVKDTGILIPGHGGLLDRIDGLIFVIIFSGILKMCNLI